MHWRYFLRSSFIAEYLFLDTDKDPFQRKLWTLLPSEIPNSSYSFSNLFFILSSKLIYRK